MGYYIIYLKTSWRSMIQLGEKCCTMLSMNPVYVKIEIKTTTFTCCFQWCETWSLTLRGEHRLRMFENQVLRKVFGPTKMEVTGGWKKIHIEFHNLYVSLNSIRMSKWKRIRWVGGCSMHGRDESKFWLQNLKGKSRSASHSSIAFGVDWLVWQFCQYMTPTVTYQRKEQTLRWYIPLFIWRSFDKGIVSSFVQLHVSPLLGT
jgi:hypothetical protein